MTWTRTDFRQFLHVPTPEPLVLTPVLTVVVDPQWGQVIVYDADMLFSPECWDRVVHQSPRVKVLD